MLESGLWVILLEAGLALGLVVFIVWWTMPRKPRAPEPESKPDEESQRDKRD